MALQVGLPDVSHMNNRDTLNPFMHPQAITTHGTVGVMRHRRGTVLTQCKRYSLQIFG